MRSSAVLTHHFASILVGQACARPHPTRHLQPREREKRIWQKRVWRTLPRQTRATKVRDSHFLALRGIGATRSTRSQRRRLRTAVSVAVGSGLNEPNGAFTSKTGRAHFPGETALARVLLKPRKARPFFGRHPWVLDSAIDRIEGSPADGDVVDWPPIREASSRGGFSIAEAASTFAYIHGTRPSRWTRPTGGGGWNRPCSCGPH